MILGLADGVWWAAGLCVVLGVLWPAAVWWAVRRAVDEPLPPPRVQRGFWMDVDDEWWEGGE